MSEENKDLAIEAAEQWLALTDVGNADESWETAASLFKNALDAETWGASLSAAQGPIGKPIKRSLKSQKFVEELPGAPDGEYCLIEYETEFENKKNGTETVVPMKDTDGVWRVSGYFVK